MNNLTNIKLQDINKQNLSLSEIKQVFANYRASEEAQKKEAYAHQINQKVAAKKRALRKKVSANQTTKERLSWRSSTNGITNAGRVFAGVAELLGTDFENWHKQADYSEALLVAAKDVFEDSVPDAELISRTNRMVYNLMYAAGIAEKAEPVVLQDSVWHAYNNPILAAAEAGILSEDTAAEYTNYFDSIK